MKRKENGRLVRWLFVLVVAFIFGMLSSEVKALDVDFHGYFESNVILRDTTGFQYDFMDQVEAIQQRNTLKFDVDVYTKAQAGPISLEKFHFTYRGAYDSIFDLREEEYENIRKYGPTKFDLGREDIRLENDLREATFDLVYNGPGGTAFLRPGRQIISWGEVSGVTITDMINPSDNSFQMFFLNPDDLKTPLWMARLNYSIPPQPHFNLNFDAVVIPDIRPLQFAPLDQSMDAPYMRMHPFSGLQALWANPLFTGIFEDVPTEKTEYGLKVTADIGANLSVSVSYFEGISDAPGVEMTDVVDLSPLMGLPPMTPGLQAPTRVDLAHPWTETWGASFNYYIAPPIDIVLKGEVGITKDAPVALPTPDIIPIAPRPGPVLPFLPMLMRQYRLKDITQYFLGFDKNVWMRWLSPNKMVNLGFQWMHKHTSDWEPIFDQTSKQDSDLFTGMINWYWWHGKINPMIFVIYDTEETWMTRASVSWTISSNWYANVTQMSFWGDTKAKSSFTPMIRNSELTFKLGYQW